MTSVIGQFFKNVFSSSAGLVIAIIIAFFFTPYLISNLGKAQYGIWNLVFSLLAYMRLADVGIQQSLVRYVSKHYASRNWDELNGIINSSVRLYFFVSVFTLAVTFVIAMGLLKYLKIPTEYLTITQTVVVILGINQALNFASLPFCSLGPFHRFDIVSYFSIGGRILETLGIIVLLEMGFGLVQMAFVIIGLNCISVLWRYRIRRTMYPDVKFSRKDVSIEKVKELIGYGIYSFLIIIAWTVIFQTDNIVIAGFLSTEAVAVYSVPAMIVTQLRNSIMAVSIPLVPAISHFEALKDYKTIMQIYAKSTRYLHYISGYLCISILVFGGPFILLWIKKEFIDAIEVLRILIFAGAFTFPQIIANSVLLGVSKHRITFFILGSEAVANIILSLILVQYFGIAGVAWGTAIPQIIIYIFIYPRVFYKAMGASVRDFYVTASKSLGYSIVLMLPTAYIMYKLLTPDSWLYLIIDCLVVTVVMMAGLVGVILDTTDRDRVLGKMRSILGKSRA